MLLLIQKMILMLIIVITLSACNQVRSSNQNIRASQTTSKIATANLDLGIEYMKQGAYENALKNLEKAKKLTQFMRQYTMY